MQTRAERTEPSGGRRSSPAAQPLLCLAPHPDDAVLSCGGLLAGHRAGGRPATVVTIFAGPSPPTESLTPFARLLHHSWGDLPDPMTHRRQEDAAALEVLGCDGLWWDYLDAIYRHPAYNSPARLFGRPAAEEALEEELAARIAALPDGLLLFPLAIGHHVDHQLLFRVGRRLGQEGRAVAFYEDLPYAAWESGLHRNPQGDPDQGVHPRLKEVSLPLQPQVIAVTDFWAAKMEAAHCYRSQFAELSRDGVPLPDALAQYARALWPQGYGERIWNWYDT